MSDPSMNGYLHVRSDSAAYHLMGLVNVARIRTDADYLEDD